MKLKFIDVDLNPKKPRATIHLSGKLGFNKDAAELMNLSKKSFMQMAKDEDTDNVYLFPVDFPEKTARVAKAGSYYYLNVGNAFELLDFDYKKYSITFAIAADTYNNQELFKLTPVIQTERTGEEEED